MRRQNHLVKRLNTSKIPGFLWEHHKISPATPRYLPRPSDPASGQHPHHRQFRQQAIDPGHPTNPLGHECLPPPRPHTRGVQNARQPGTRQQHARAPAHTPAPKRRPPACTPGPQHRPPRPCSARQPATPLPLRANLEGQTRSVHAAPILTTRGQTREGDRHGSARLQSGHGPAVQQPTQG